MLMHELSKKEFDLFRKLIYEKSGISLNNGKQELVRTRLSKRLRNLNINTFKEYYRLVSEQSNNNELLYMLDAISTNQTSFFREPGHFTFLNETALPHILKEKVKARDKTFRIWSAGCSTGEEPCSIAITLFEFIENHPEYDIKILATDISIEVLNIAKKGIYEKSKFENVPIFTLKKYFLRGEKKWTGHYKFKPEPSRIIHFKHFNLMENHFPFSSLFDIIFCRNVMIYFDKETQEALVSKYYSILKQGCYFFIGHSESLTGIKHQFKYVQPTIYTK